MLIKGLQKITMLDYPGKIACTIFVFGCNFRCPYCHNEELVLAEEAKKLKTYSEKEVLNFLKKRKKFLEGTCITGGEPTLYPELLDFIKKIKKLGYLIKLDTNGTNPAMLKKLLRGKLVDYVAMDFKAPFEKYEQIVNAKVDLDKIKESIDIIKKFPDYEFRITIVPEQLEKKDLLEIAKFLKEKKANKAFYLQQFRNDKCLDKEFEKKSNFPLEKLKEYKKVLEPYFQGVEIRTEIY